MTAEQTLANRRAVAGAWQRHAARLDRHRDRRVASDVSAGPGVKIQPSPLGTDEIGYIRKDAGDGGAGIFYASGKRGPKGDIRTASWSPDGSRVVFHKRQTAPPTVWRSIWSRNPELRVDADRHPAVVQSGRRSIRHDRSYRRRQRLRRQHRRCRDRQRQVRGDLRGQDAQRPRAAVVAERRQNHFRHRRVQRVLQRIQRPVPQARGSRRRRRADRRRQSRWQRLSRSDDAVPTTTGFRRWRPTASGSSTGRSARRAMACAS